MFFINLSIFFINLLPELVCGYSLFQCFKYFMSNFRYWSKKGFGEWSLSLVKLYILPNQYIHLVIQHWYWQWRHQNSNFFISPILFESVMLIWQNSWLKNYINICPHFQNIYINMYHVYRANLWEIWDISTVSTWSIKTQFIWPWSKVRACPEMAGHFEVTH